MDGMNVGADERAQAQACQPEQSCSLVKKFFQINYKNKKKKIF